MLCHGYAPTSFLHAAVIPIPKNVKLNMSSTCNYRAIALSSIFSKILDKIIMSLQSEYLMTSELQFGFREHSSNIMCSTLLVETVEYYVSNNSSVYVLLIDASKAFDRLCHSKLFDVLETFNVCPLVRRLLYNIYCRSEMHVQWNSAHSTPFPLNNGVKQGGVLSPILFSMYIDSLLEKLKESGLGCHVGRTFAGAFAYADDIALVSPSLSGLRQMIHICEQYAMEYSIVFNPVNSKLMCFNSVSSDKPYLTLCGKPVDVVDNDLHLGNRIYNNIYTQCSNSMISDFYRRSNQVKTSFRMCDSFTLSNLHSTFCNSFYGIELYNFNKAPLKKLYTAWRKCMRIIFCLPNTTQNYIISHLDYNIMERLDRRLVKYIYNILHTNNSTVQSIVNSKLLLYPNSVLSENYKYIMSKYKISHLDWNPSLLHVLNKIEVPPLSVHELSVCNTVRELCQLRDNLYSCDIDIDTTDIIVMLNVVCTE